MAKIKKHRLTIDPAPDYILIAIASHEKGYHLSWILNEKSGFSFARTSDYKIMRKKGKTTLVFPVFSSEDEIKMLRYYLISNRTENGFLFEELRAIDYLLHISPDPGKEFSDQLQTELKKIPVIYTCFLIDPEIHPETQTLQLD